MRKRKTKLSNIIMFLLLLLVLFYLVFQQRSIKITAEELADNYSLNQGNADKKFLNKNLEVTGEVKSYYDFENENSIIELKTVNNKTELFCILINKEIEKKAQSLTSGTPITVYGKCLGFNPPKAEKFFPGIYIETDRIK